MPAFDTAQRTGVEPSWPEPDMSILQLERPRPPRLPLAALGPAWAEWITTAAEAASCPPDYVAAPLLAAASALIGHARWAKATPGWMEPPHIWLGVVGEPGTGKSPGSDALMRDVLPEIERRMLADFPDRVLAWRVDVALRKAANRSWRQELRPESMQPLAAVVSSVRVTSPPERQMPRLQQHDVTVEKVAELLARAAPKGVLIVRDELAGWIAGMNGLSSGARAFWIEAYGGRPYRVERKTDPDPIVVPRLAVSVYGGIQPAKLARLVGTADDGLLGRLLWVWPEAVRFRLGQQTPRIDWAVRALDRLRELDLQPSDPPRPTLVPLTNDGRALIECFARRMQDQQRGASALFQAALGKARGQVLRLALVLEFLWWCGQDGNLPPPTRVSPHAVAVAAELISEYFLPMAERVYADTPRSMWHRSAATLARWILQTRATEVHIRHLQRQVRLPGLRTAEQIREVWRHLWLRAGFARQPRGGALARVSEFFTWSTLRLPDWSQIGRAKYLICP